MHYFAYGSNMNYEHMRRLCGWHFVLLGQALLKNYEFGPDGRGYANIRPKNGNQVYGVLYDLDQEALDTLDEFEGYPNVFSRKRVSVLDKEQKLREAWVYLEPAERFGAGQIKTDYLKRVVVGAQENHLPEPWVIFLSSFLEQRH